MSLSQSESLGAAEKAIQFLSLGGPVLWALLVMSIIASVVVLVKCVQFANLRLTDDSSIAKALSLWRQNEKSSALDLLLKKKSPANSLIAEVARLYAEQAAKDTVKEEAVRLASMQLTMARRHLKILETIASLSPLLGLLGTVLGMIVAFQKLQMAGNAVDPAILSGGIWEALITTAAGLCVAIPTMVALNYLEQKVERFKHIMEDGLTQLFTVELYV